MGGFGSGKRSYKRESIEECYCLDVRDLHRRGLLEGEKDISWAWQKGGKPAGRINIYTFEGRLELRYRHLLADGSWQDESETVALVWTDCHYGGRRPWFECPGCGRRVAVLANPGKLFLCRHCYRLSYWSKQKPRIDRLKHQADKLRERLGAKTHAGLGNSFPDKPKWMRWRTYQKLCERISEAEASIWHTSLPTIRP